MILCSETTRDSHQKTNLHTMDALISTFHLDLKLLIAQAVNFGIVFLVLFYFVFRPLFRVMGDRSAKIDKGLKEAEEIAARLEKTKAEQKEMIKEAKAEANALLEEARKQADERRNAAVQQAKEEIGQLINQEKAKIQADKADALRQIRSELSSLIGASLEKVLGEKMDKASDEKLITKSLKHLE